MIPNYPTASLRPSRAQYPIWPLLQFLRVNDLVLAINILSSKQHVANFMRLGCASRKRKEVSSSRFLDLDGLTLSLDIGVSQCSFFFA
jgi:hypothetical protein